MTRAEAVAPGRHWRVVADGLAAPHDNFLPLRLVAAALVIYGHGPAMAGAGGPQDLFGWLGWKTYSGSLAVDLFFIVSGFLVTGSNLRRDDPWSFLGARALRIVPAFAVCMVLTTVVVGAACTRLSLAEYLAAAGTWDYLRTNLQLGVKIAAELPGVFVDNPHTRTVNGSIWTLLLEVRLYVILAILGALGLLRRRSLGNLVLGAGLALAVVVPERIALVDHPDSVRLTVLFTLGALCYVNREHVPLHGAAVVLFAAAAWWLHDSRLYPAAFSLAEVAFVLWFAYGLPALVHDGAGDYSYGVYLWGFPMQQVAAQLAPGLGALGNSAVGLALALPLGVASWHLVEEPALAWKSTPSAREPALEDGRARGIDDPHREGAGAVDLDLAEVEVGLGRLD